MCFICACTYVCSYTATILYLSRHMKYSYNAAWVVTILLATCFLTFMSIPTSLFKFKIFKNSCLFTFCGIL